ncbi:MAG: PaaI family thioesterase [Candidatus Hodarchaeota archaeon]
MNSTRQKTHTLINNQLCGTPIELDKGFAKIKLKTDTNMITDETGLIHGGFIFNLADFAAMLAVNHPNVVLGGANVKFIRPVVKGEILIAKALVDHRDGRKIIVKVEVFRGNEKVFNGEFFCFTPEKHVLKKLKQ